MKKILFFGELAPRIVHGISLANKLNLSLLNEYFEISIIEEKTNLKNHNIKSISKIKTLMLDLVKIFKLNNLKNSNHFYTVFSLSTLGSLKTLLSIVSFKISGKKGIINLHIHRGDFKEFYFTSIYNRIITKIILKLTNKLIVLSEEQKKEFSEYICNNKIYVLENSLNEEYEFASESNKNRNFIYISNYIKEKGIFELLKVFQNQNESTLECFGGFVNNEKIIREYESSNIIINNFINGKEKYMKIANSSAVILPSWNEGQPTIILEAMMLGKIVLTTKVGLIKELLGENYPFYFKEKDPDSLERCIKKFIAYNYKEKLGEELKKLYIEKYSKEVHKKKLIKIFGD